MKAWKRNLLIAYLVCSVLVIVFFYIFAFGSSIAPFLKFLLFLLGLAVIAGILTGIYVVIYAYAHEHATLHTGPEGAINIERSALESTARRALASVPGIAVQDIRANVIERKGDPVIDLAITAVPLGADSLMTTASRIQTATKRAIEAFTDHEVRYVAVNFIEPRKQRDVKGAAESVDARAASEPVVPRYADARGSTDVVAGGAVKESLWDRAKARMAFVRSQKDEDVVETDALVETIVDEPIPASPASAQTAAEPQVADKAEVPPSEAESDNADNPDGK